MSFTFNNRKSLKYRRQCDRCGKLAKDAEAGTYQRPGQYDGVIKSRGTENLNEEFCEECWKELQATNPRAT